MIGQGAKGSDGTKVRTWVGILRFVIAPRERAAMPGTRSAQPIVASGLPTAPTGRIHDRSQTTRQRRQKPLAQQGPSIHDERSGTRPTRGDIRHGFVYERVPHIMLSSIANNAEVERRRDIDRRWAEERARSQMEAEAPRSRINANGREALARDREHLTISGTFQSDKYPWCPAGFVPLKLTDSMARDLLLIYARRRAEVDKEFERDLVEALDRTKA